jgi:hypothetical protein
MKITLLLATIALLAVLFVCLLPAVMKHNKAHTVRTKRRRLRYAPLNALEKLALPFVLGMQCLHGFHQRIFGDTRLVACNVAEGTHTDSVSKLTDAAIATRHLLYRRGSDDNHIAASAASDALPPLGPVADEAAAAEEYVAVQLLGKGSTKLMIASEAMTVGDEVWTAAAGKVQDRTAAAGTYWIVGTALTAAGADGDIIEVQDCVPIRITVT